MHIIKKIVCCLFNQTNHKPVKIKYKYYFREKRITVRILRNGADILKLTGCSIGALL